MSFLVSARRHEGRKYVLRIERLAGEKSRLNFIAVSLLGVDYFIQSWLDRIGVRKSRSGAKKMCCHCSCDHSSFPTDRESFPLNEGIRLLDSLGQTDEERIELKEGGTKHFVVNEKKLLNVRDM